MTGTVFITGTSSGMGEELRPAVLAAGLDGRRNRPVVCVAHRCP